jgi:hypothetical protein
MRRRLKVISCAIINKLSYTFGSHLDSYTNMSNWDDPLQYLNFCHELFPVVEHLGHVGDIREQMSYTTKEILKWKVG